MNNWRHFKPGSDHPKARFSPEEVEQIRRERAQGKGVRELARERDCQPSTISRIARGERYGEKE